MAEEAFQKGVFFAQVADFLLLPLMSGAVITDFQSERISNRLILCGLGAGLVYQIAINGAMGFLYFLGNASFPILILIPLFLIHAFGAGDIKLFSVVSAFMDFHFTINFMMVSFVIAAVFCCMTMLKNRNLLARLLYFASYVREGLESGSWPRYYTKKEGKGNIVHFSVFMLVGFCLCRIMEM